MYRHRFCFYRITPQLRRMRVDTPGAPRFALASYSAVGVIFVDRNQRSVPFDFCGILTGRSQRRIYEDALRFSPVKIWSLTGS